MMSGGAFSSPTLAEIAGRVQLLVQTRLSLNGVDLDTGRVLWKQAVPNYRGMNILTPAVHGDTVFTSTYKQDSFLYKVEPANGGYTVREIWRNKVKDYMSTPVVIGDFAHLHLANQRFTCLDLRTGESRWTTEPFGKHWSMAVRDGKTLALDERGELHLVQANPERFELLDSREIATSPTWGHVAVAGNQVFVRELEAVSAYRWP
jgi:outer membrane protein assembly factor BamB